MEAKGCAKSAVWKESRRYFYWAVRARVARSAALRDLADASPGSTLEYRARLLDTLAEIDATTTHRDMADRLEALDLTATVSQLRADHLLRRLLELTKEDRKATMNGLMRLADNLSEEERASVISVLQNASRSPGKAVPSSPVEEVPHSPSRSPLILMKCALLGLYSAVILLISFSSWS